MDHGHKYQIKFSLIFLHELLQVPVNLRVGSEPDPVPGSHGHKVLVESLLKSLPVSGRDVDSVMILRNPGSHARLSFKEATLRNF